VPEEVYASPQAAKKFVDKAFAVLTPEEKPSFGFAGYTAPPPALAKGKKAKKSPVEPSRCIGFAPRPRARFDFV